MQKRDGKNYEVVEAVSMRLYRLETKGKGGKKREKARSSGGSKFFYSFPLA